jgi:hypothetical protein
MSPDPGRGLPPSTRAVVHDPRAPNKLSVDDLAEPIPTDGEAVLDGS